MKIRIDLKIFVFLVIFFLTRQIKLYGILMIFAFIHELGHIVAGMLLGFKPEKLEIMPYGLSVGFKTKCDDYNRKIKKSNMLSIKKMIIAIAGPLTNLLIIIISLIFPIKFFNIEREMIIYSNILIGLFNLIPIYPLDGGRIIKNALHINIGFLKSYKYTNLISKVAIVILTIISSIIILYIRNISIIIILAYLWYLVITQDIIYERKMKILKKVIQL